MRTLNALLFGLLLVQSAEAVGLARGLYCGLEICYDVLGIDRETFNKTDLSRIYRQLARKFHPDRVKEEEKKEEATERFRQITTAYETLKDDETREYYDYYLDHPEERYYNYYQYYRMRAAPKVDFRLVLLGTIVLVSTIQYLSAHQKYSEAIQYAKEQVKFRNMALDIAREKKLLEFDRSGKVKKKQPNGADPERVIGGIIEENISVSGGYKKASLHDTLFMWILFSPLTAWQLAVFWYKWALKYWIRKEEYDDEAKLYLIRKNLGVSEEQFHSFEEALIDDYLAHELWKKPEFQRWKEAKEEEEREKMASSARYRQFRRYMKKQAGNTISFLED
ncbi:J domain-containing protein [Aphelenchoides fujianensis]|nr:J domain-containing protein [Aphelenchoides fujianensis]